MNEPDARNNSYHYTVGAQFMERMKADPGAVIDLSTFDEAQTRRYFDAGWEWGKLWASERRSADDLTPKAAMATLAGERVEVDEVAMMRRLAESLIYVWTEGMAVPPREVAAFVGSWFGPNVMPDYANTERVAAVAALLDSWFGVSGGPTAGSDAKPLSGTD